MKNYLKKKKIVWKNQMESYKTLINYSLSTRAFNLSKDNNMPKRLSGFLRGVSLAILYRDKGKC